MFGLFITYCKSIFLYFTNFNFAFCNWYLRIFSDKNVTVEPRPVDTPLQWTPHHCGHFSPGPFDWPVATPSFTIVDTSLLWTLFVWPLAVHISEYLLHKNACSSLVYGPSFKI